MGKLKKSQKCGIIFSLIREINRDLSKEFDCMKKLIALVLAVVCVLGLGAF